MENNPFEKLIGELGYHEFVRQLIRFEKDPILEEDVEKILKEFIENDHYFTIFQIQEIIDSLEIEDFYPDNEFCECGNILDEYNICRECI